ncbi:hypothetical protein VTJ04DRAFT_9854 [Mycothermus thermophilus]|uniref:uncharacterized protein n=1 Tax=Humicola insolens TaxID=85995 RepID=UPI003742DAEB
MPLGSALPWRACLALGRIHRLPLLHHYHHHYHHHQHQRPLLAQLRFLSTAPEKQHEADPPEPKPSPSSSFIERLDRLPVRRHPDLDPVVFEPVTVYPNKKESKYALQKSHKALLQQVRLEKRRRTNAPGDWRQVLRNLIRASPQYREGVKITLSKSQLDLLLSHPVDNLWEMRSRTGINAAFHYPVDNAAEEGESEAYVILSGLDNALTTVIDDITKTVGPATISRARDSDLAKTNRVKGRNPFAPDTGTVDQPRMFFSKRFFGMNVEEIPRPETWTTESFYAYVAALTKARPETGGSNSRAVVTLLCEAFHDHAASSVISYPALRCALEYMAPHGSAYAGHLWSLLDRAKSVGLHMGINEFNDLLETAVASKNMLAFACNIDQMLRMGVLPNEWTWVLFLRIVEAEEVCRYILKAMADKNYFADPRMVIWASKEMAEHDMYRAIQLGQSLDEFLASVQELYGPDWQLRTSTANKYLNVLGRYSKLVECKQLLKIMAASEHAQPNTISLNTVITHCKHHNRADIAIDFVQWFEEQGYHQVADSLTLYLLFAVARTIKKPHLTSAVWRYAHLSRKAVYWLRRGGRQILVQPEKTQRLVGRLGALWEMPGGCKMTKEEWVRELFFYDYRTSEEWLGNDNLETQNGAEAKQRDPEQSATSKPSSSSATERATPGSLRPGKECELFFDWAEAKAETHTPAIPLGTFLRRALDLDLRLHRLAWERQALLRSEAAGDEDVPDTREDNVPVVQDNLALLPDGTPADMCPLELPLKPRKEEEEVEVDEGYSRDSIRQQQQPDGTEVTGSGDHADAAAAGGGGGGAQRPPLLEAARRKLEEIRQTRPVGASKSPAEKEWEKLVRRMEGEDDDDDGRI